jgi:osmotically-inducible protein OsmY
MKTLHRNTLATSLTLVASAALIAACDQPTSTSSGGSSSMAPAVASAEQHAKDAGSDIRKAGQDAVKATGQAMDSAGDKVNDASITAAVNAQLAADPKLSALQIDVDTVGGKVMLSGKAPDASSREHAASLAARVDGVVAVDNRLSVEGKS